MISLKSLQSKLFPSNAEKKQYLHLLEDIEENIEDYVITMGNTLKDNLIQDDLSDDSKKFISLLSSVMKLKKKDEVEFLLDALISFGKEIQLALPDLRAITETELSNFMTDKSLTVRESATIATLNNVWTMLIYISDIYLYIIYYETGKDLVKGKKKEIIDGTIYFAELYTTYVNFFKKHVLDLKKLSDNKVGDDAVDLKHAMSNMDKKFKLPVNNFTYNPIYHFRLWITDLRIKQYDSLKEKKRLLDLKIHELRLDQHNKNDSSLDKQIDYHENRLQKIEASIKEFETEIED